MNAYLRLMRFDKPVGIYLLWFPTAWALWMANQGFPSLKLLLCFALGTIVMRAAGCVMNDIADRRIDKYVTRTANRPITSGEIPLMGACLSLLCLLIMAFGILLELNPLCVFYAIPALLIAFIYPFCKRFFQTPQLILGFAFSMGMPMAYCASGIAMGCSAYLLILLNVIWIIAYDTMYAMVDRKDDLLIGVKSSAIFFGTYDVFILGVLQGILHSLWLLIAVLNQYHFSFYILWGSGAVILGLQQRLVSTRIEENCFLAFKLNVWYGLALWVGLICNFYHY